jgi:putative MFS transporter
LGSAEPLILEVHSHVDPATIRSIALQATAGLERKWIICGAAVAISAFGMAFSQLAQPALLILSGVLITAANMTMSYAYHAYQTEVFPTSIRARASSLVYSMSRVSATFSGFIVAYVLREAGVGGVFGLITSAMFVVIIAIATFGPNVRGKPLDA